MKTYKTMLKNEIKLSLRGMDMLIFAICMPVIVIVLLGIIYGNKPAFDGANYTFLEQSFAAVSTIAICAGGLMGLPLVVSDYRNRKILKRYKVTPISPVMILLVQVTIYTLYSLISLALIYVVATLFFDFKMVGSFGEFLLSFVLVMLSMFSIGMMVGGIAPNTKIASTVASILYFPMLIFSGATLPYEVMPVALQKFSDILPLTQGIKLLKGTSLGMPIENVMFPIILMVGISVVCMGIAIKFFKWE
ncbi:ABC transporter permease [Thomasclavelia cocleata]|uniref:ABC transporter permease n=1 Tax=Thomasclavelia cocleata TaxID=69824 RepID=UPI00248B573C|nr:ABC transporter permease [Thomasclavelia cocleata]